MKTLTSLPIQRISVLDALRGFALLGVIIMHMLQKFGIPNPPPEEAYFQFPILDQAMKFIGRNIVMGRFINIFAFLFGLSFFIQIDRSAQKGINFSRRFAWRMSLLLVFGLLIHSFYSLEILSVYAFFGLLILPLYKVNQWVLLGLFAFLLLGGPRILQITDHNYQLEITEKKSDTTSEINPGTLELPAHLSQPSLLNSVKYNYQERLWGKLNYQFGFIGRGYVTLALFILGLWVGRIRFFETITQFRKRNYLLLAGFSLAFLLVSLLLTLFPEMNIRIFFRPQGNFLSPTLGLYQSMQDLNLFLFSAILTMAFISLYQTAVGERILSVLSPYGRMALTNYVGQGILGFFLFSPWCLGSSFGSYGAFTQVMAGLLIYIIQILYSRQHLKTHYYGLLEWAWRSATYMKWQSYQKNKKITWA